jgi:hypothetical protein
LEVSESTTSLTGESRSDATDADRYVLANDPHSRAVTSADADLVVLSDNLVADPRMLRDLRIQGVAHLAVRGRDGTGLVGPLVVPGVNSCLDNY